MYDFIVVMYDYKVLIPAAVVVMVVAVLAVEADVVVPVVVLAVVCDMLTDVVAGVPVPMITHKYTAYQNFALLLTITSQSLIASDLMYGSMPDMKMHVLNLGVASPETWRNAAYFRFLTLRRHISVNRKKRAIDQQNTK